MTRLDCGVPKLHGHGALDQPRQLPESRGDLGGRRRRQLHLPVLDESRPPRSGVRCERGIEHVNVYLIALVYFFAWVQIELCFCPSGGYITEEKSIIQKI